MALPLLKMGIKPTFDKHENKFFCVFKCRSNLSAGKYYTNRV